MFMFMTYIPEEEHKKYIPLGEVGYFSNTNSTLQSINCPTCNEVGGLFVGFNFICCRNCSNLYLTEDELIR